MFKDKQFTEFFHEAREISREQLHNYPNQSKKSITQHLKSNLKNFLLRSSSKPDRFFWPNSLLAISMELSYLNHKDKRDFESLVSYYDKWINSGLRINNLDNTMNGYSLVYIFEETNDVKYKEALEVLANYLLDHPKDKYGSLPYRKNNLNIFVDSVGMICPFLCRYGKLSNNSRIVNLAVAQLINFLKYGLDEEKYLPYHAYNANDGIKLGVVGWGRALGWLLIGLVDSLEHIDKGTNNYNALVEAFNKLVDTAIKFQRYDGYFTWQLESKEGPVDSSSTSMIAYAIRKGIKIKLLDESFLNNTDLAISALYKSTNKGIVGDCSAECMGLSMYPQNYASYPWSQGPTTALLAISLET